MDELASLVHRWTLAWGESWHLERRPQLEVGGIAQYWCITRDGPYGMLARHVRLSAEQVAEGQTEATLTQGAQWCMAWEHDEHGPTGETMVVSMPELFEELKEIENA